MRKIEKQTMTIKGKEYAFLKPLAIDLIDLEDRVYNIDGTMDIVKYNRGMLAMVTREITLEDLVELKISDVVLSSGETLRIPEMSYEKWVNFMGSMKTFSRSTLAKKAISLTGVSGEINLSNFSYEDIDNLAASIYSMYNVEELNKVVEEINSFCI